MIGIDSPPTTISVVIPTFNRRESVLTALDPLLRDPAVSQVIVAIDGSSDGTAEALQTLSEEHPKLRPLAAPNQGQSAARQRGARAASGDLLWFLDDDIIAPEGLAEGHLARHRSEASLVVSGYAPVVVPGERGPGSFPTFLAAEEYERSCERVERTGRDVLTALWGSNFSIRRSDYLRVVDMAGAFAATYHEDQDFGLWCLRAGLHGRLDRSLEARHNHARSVASFRHESRQQGAGRALIARRHPEAASREATVFDHGLPRAARAVLRWSRRPRLAAMSIGALALLMRTAAVMRLPTAESTIARLLRRFEQQRAFLAAMRDGEV